MRALSLLDDVEVRARLFGCGRLDVGEVGPYKLLFDEIELEAGDPITFNIDLRSDGARTLKLMSSCQRTSTDARAGDIAIVAPTYWDISFAVACKIANSYRTVVVDVQGFSRLNLGRVASTTMLTRFAKCSSSHTLRASIDDVGITGLAEASRYLDVITFNGLLIVVNDGDSTHIVEPVNVLRDVQPVGAGDMYDAFLALAMYAGYDLLDAAVLAHAATVRALRGERLKFFSLEREAWREVRVFSVPSRRDLGSVISRLVQRLPAP